MTPATIAQTRFGYGFGNRDRAPSSGRAWLFHQISHYEPLPPEVALRLERHSEIGQLHQRFRMLRQESKAAMAKPAERSSDFMSPMPNRAPPPAQTSSAMAYRNAIVEARSHLEQDIALRVRIAANSPTPMMERLVHFWSNHFSVSSGKRGTEIEVGPHEFGAIRPHILGRFSDMLKAAVLHPAMLVYLDQFRSIGPNSPIEQRRAARGVHERPRRGINENLAREVLELHTLGVKAGYTQADVTEFALALTGWTLSGFTGAGGHVENQPNGAAFDVSVHEPGDRRLLGRAYRASGSGQAIAILDDLARHPATARHIATKFARHFAGDTPPPALVTKLEADFLRSGGDLASLTRTLIEAPEPWQAEPLKFVTPFEWLIATMRLVGVDQFDEKRIRTALARLDHVPWRAPSPAGYDDVAGIWAAPDALMRRVELANWVARDAPADDILGSAEATIQTLGTTTRMQLARAESSRQALVLLLVSPEMMRR
jgi:uncharacterized protein (DUF1800 family)